TFPPWPASTRATMLLPRRGARRGIPFGTVRLLLEMQRSEPWRPQIDGIVDRTGNRDPRLATLHVEEIPILGEHGVGTVGHTVLAQVAGAHVGGRDFQRPGRWRTARVLLPPR